MSNKNLFLPLKGKYYDAFESGEKKEEYRLAGAGWNARTCWVGRLVTLSRGYGRSRRLLGRIVSFREEACTGTLLGFKECYGNQGPAAVIGIEILGKDRGKKW